MLAPAAKEVRHYHDRLRIFFSGSSLMCCSMRGRACTYGREGVQTKRILRAAHTLAPKAPAPRVNSGLNSTVRSSKVPSGGILEIRFTVSQEAPFLSEEPKRVTAPRGPSENGGIHTPDLLVILFTLQLLLTGSGPIFSKFQHS